MKSLKDLLPYGKIMTALIIGAAPPPRQLVGWPMLLSLLAYGGVVLFITPRVKNKPTVARIRIAIAFIAGLALAIVYVGQIPVRTATYKNERVIIGNTLQTYPQDWINTNKSNALDYFKWNKGNPEVVWTRESISANTTILAALYLPCVFLIAFALLGAVEFVPEQSNWIWIVIGTVLLVLAGIFIGLYFRAYFDGLIHLLSP